MSRREEIEKQLSEFVTQEMLDGDPGGLTPTTNLLQLGVIDSLSIVSLRLFIENNFGVRLPEGTEARDFATVTMLADLVERLERERRPT